eukprot:EG_transcript_9977
MGHFYDVAAVQQVLRRHGIRAVQQQDEQPPVPGEPFAVPCDDVSICTSLASPSIHHKAVGCPFGEWLVTAQQVATHAALVQAVLLSLQPSPAMDGHLREALRPVQHSSPFSFLHVRLEEDWIRHCRSWTSATRDNCLSNTWYLPEQLRAKGFPTERPLYLTSHWPLVSPSERQLLLSQLRRAGYQVILTPRSAAVARLHREEAALVNYFVGMRAGRTLGNSVSTFSALLMLERRLQGRFAAQYNGGNVPLSGLLPLYHLPWVFTILDVTDGPYVQAAVRSAAAVGGLAPYCLHHTVLAPALLSWLRQHNVTLLRHRPTWQAWLPARYPGMPAHRLIAAFLRIDVPFLAALRQYEYVLTTGPRVLFRRPLSLDAFPYPLPKAIGVVDGALGPEEVVLMALDGLRAQHSQLLDFLHTAATPPACVSPLARPDYCALTSFFSDAPARWALPRPFDASWFEPFDNSSAILTLRVPRRLQTATAACRTPG